MIFLDDRAGPDVVETNRENLDAHRFNMNQGREGAG
jgi:hypothetical protein